MGRTAFWTAEKVALLGMHPDKALGERFGVSRLAVRMQRYRRGIPAKHGSPRHQNWGQTDLGLLRSYTNSEIAKMTGRSSKEVAAKRKSLRIGPSFSKNLR